MTNLSRISKTMLLSAGLIASAVILPSTASGQTPDVLTKLYECKALTDNTARLNCYDSAAGRVEAAQQTGELVAIDREAAEEIQRESFGFNIPSLPKLNIFNRGNKDAPDVKKVKIEKPTFTSVSLPIESVRTMSNGRVKYYLKNGQVWQQTETKRMGKYKSKQDNVLFIEKGAFGSYFGRVNNKGAKTRVKRVS